MRAIRPDEATRRRTHKPETISWQCKDVGDENTTCCRRGSRNYEKEDAKNGILPLFPTTFNNQKKR